MSLPIPISVRIRARQDRHVTADLRDLTYRGTAPGGFASARLSFHRPLSIPAEEVAHYAPVWVYGNDGEVLWEGRLEDPGRGAGNDGEVYEINALGPVAHTRDRALPAIYADQDLSALVRPDSITPDGTDQRAEDPAGSANEALVLTFPRGMDVVANDRILMRYNRIWRAGQKLARVSYTHDEGVIDANHQTRAFAATLGGGGGADMFSSVNWSTTAGNVSGVVVTNWTDGRNALDLQAFRSGGAATLADDVHWTSITNLAIRAMLFGANGAELTTGYTADTVLASEVVKDLLGRVLTKFDGTNAVIATTSYGINQVAYPDPVHAQKILDDLTLLEPDYYFAAWESNAAGKHRCEYTRWPTKVRFETDLSDDFASPASGDGLYNAVQVRYQDRNGETVTVRVTSTVPALDNAGLTREATIDLGREVGSASNALQVGTAFLAEHAAPPNRGTLEISGPLFDTVTGRVLQPWDLPRRAPGSLIRVRGVLPNVDSLNATARDGVTVFKVVAADFNAASASARLELDARPLTVASLLAHLATQTRRR